MEPTNNSGSPKPVSNEQMAQPQASSPVPGLDDNGQTQNPIIANQPVQSSEAKTDVYGIISIVLAVVGFSLVGVIIGYIGMKKAKQAGYSPVLSKVGFWISLAMVIFGLLWFGFWLIFAFTASRT